MAKSTVINPAVVEIQLSDGIKIRDVEFSMLDIAPEMKSFRDSAWQRSLSLSVDENKPLSISSEKTKEEESYSWQTGAIKAIDSTAQIKKYGQTGFSGQIIIHDREYHTDLDPKYARQGVILCDLLTAEKEHSELLTKYLGKLDISREHRLAALAQAAATGGFFLYVPAGVNIELPLLVKEKYSKTVDLIINHSMVILENAASATLAVESRSDYLQREGILLESRQTFLEPAAYFRSLGLQSLSENTMNYRYERVHLDKDARIEWITSHQGSKMTRGYAEFELVGEGSSASVAGIYIPNESQQFDFYTKQDHQAANTSSNLLYKGVLLDKSQTTWRGMINISNNAARSQSYQTNNNLILSDQAHIDSIPGMEILTNDVQCKHGATIGKIDPRQLFYLESRGIDTIDAARMLAEGFLDAIIQKYPDESFKSAIKASIQEKLSHIRTQNSL